MTSSTSPAARRDELAARLETVRRRISVAAPAGTDPTLIVVTKYFPAADVELLAGLGVQDVGENKDQEASAKSAETAQLGLSWHFIGQLQSNKAKSVVRYAAAVHSVDRLSLVSALDKAMTVEQQRRADADLPPRAVLDCFLQVDLRNPNPSGPGAVPAAGEPGGGPGRGGAMPADLPALADAVAARPGLRLAGVMAVAPLQEDPGAAFARLQALSDRLRAEYPEASGISAGMSRDLEAALAHGATHLRIGSDILGPRPAVR
ncbi:YggS family pyridoxal phosphate enzyme [Arthrobacter jiangjiafuii]|uniref:Pyridoxal phosphate homeostasis protein n=1 Tax=Arthrobacter jiangjiafuii TaxID=2817475 RepID=A0A975M7A3_9MICC|nr:YggS family pyridoxal phosphate enzyme [Arthrobacter jiangjiafuii]MBP3044270.1 YggS family pyridoxal phosphate enzyme [Arthrobacter jiangjiafuii]QWC11227.1 YggS family pyridoxal phosphate enzyme [Arthrobacter jiangjiafuii]